MPLGSLRLESENVQHKVQQPALQNGPRPSCSHCFSKRHSRPNCKSHTRCSACFRLGHVTFSCRFPPRFPGLSKDRIFSSQLHTATWDPTVVSTWFKSAQSQTGGATPPVITPTSSSSIPWSLTNSTFLEASAQPSSLDVVNPSAQNSPLVTLELCAPPAASASTAPPPPPPPPPPPLGDHLPSPF